MSKYTKLEDWRVFMGGDSYRVTEAVLWEVGRKGSGLWVTVPVGFSFDFSRPWALAWLMDAHNPRLLKAACLHDYALHVLGWDRTTAAALFTGALKADGVGPFTRYVYTLAVITWKWS